MVDFLKIDLENYGQPAIVRLRDEIEYGDLIIVQAHFNESGATITHMRSDRKPKVRVYGTEEMDSLCAAWLDYQARVAAYKLEQEAAEQVVIAEARTLASSVKFDLDTLNIQIDKDEDGCWQVYIPAIRFERYCPVDDLKETVQEAIDRLCTDVIRTEKYSWDDTGEWKEIIASYRRVFPLEPQEITEAKRLLTEAGIENWNITPNGTDPGYYHFYVGETAERENWPAAQLLEEIREYVSNSQEVTERGEVPLKVKVNVQAPEQQEECQICEKLFNLRDLKKLGTGCEMLVVCDSCGQQELQRRQNELQAPESVTLPE